MPVPTCPNCEYDTRGLPSDVCPECGERLPDLAPPVAPRLEVRLALAFVIIAATLLVGWFTTMVPSIPVWWGPLPLPVVFPLFITENRGLAMVPIFITAALLMIPVILGRVQIPWATTVPVAALMALAMLSSTSSISFALQYHGSFYVVVSLSIHLAMNASLIAIWIHNRRRQRYVFVVLWHMLASLWLASYAFPYYGELP